MWAVVSLLGEAGGGAMAHQPAHTSLELLWQREEAPEKDWGDRTITLVQTLLQTDVARASM